MGIVKQCGVEFVVFLFENDSKNNRQCMLNVDVMTLPFISSFACIFGVLNLPTMTIDHL